jgi:hypothetical protein
MSEKGLGAYRSAAIRETCRRACHSTVIGCNYSVQGMIYWLNDGSLILSFNISADPIVRGQ